MTPIRPCTAKRLGLRRPEAAPTGVAYGDPASLLAGAGFPVPSQDEWAGIAKTLRAAAWRILTAPRTL